METTRDALAVKWVRRRTLIAKLEAVKAAHKFWLRQQDPFLEFESKVLQIKNELKATEHAMDQCVALGDQGDFLVGMDRENAEK